MFLSSRKSLNCYKRLCLRQANHFLKSHRFGLLSLISRENSLILNKQVEACRKMFRISLKKTAKISISPFQQIPVTKKPQEIRMGKGKGSVKF